ncbi:hypothetical protein HDV06_002580 [Boothiomyces sp. JEL0866]|nr:hypothetical protein HDV06_002580 [Boothiomyces sp. JEL0866]
MVLLSLCVTIIPNVVLTIQQSSLLDLLRMTRTFRLIRSVRTLRHVNAVKSIQIILETLNQSLIAMSNIFLLTLLIGCKIHLKLDMYTLIAVFLYGSIDPYNFGSVGNSAMVFVQVASLDLWSNIYMKSKSQAPDINKEIMASYYMNLASLEHNMNLYDRHNRLVEDLIGILKKNK